jgi:hypothetical protein
MIERGRSRHVSQVALARCMLEEQYQKRQHEQYHIASPISLSATALRLSKPVSAPAFTTTSASSSSTSHSPSPSPFVIRNIPRLVLPSLGPIPGPSTSRPQPLVPAVDPALHGSLRLLPPPTEVPAASSSSVSAISAGTTQSSRTPSPSPMSSPGEPRTPACGVVSQPFDQPDVYHDDSDYLERVDEHLSYHARSLSKDLYVERIVSFNNDHIPDDRGLELPPECAAAYAAAEAASARWRVEEELWAERGRWAEKTEDRWDRLQTSLRDEREQARSIPALFGAESVRATSVITVSSRSCDIYRTESTTPIASSSKLVTPSRQQMPSARSVNPEYLPRQVTLQDVFHSMHGTLFDEEPEEVEMRSQPGLDCLLEPVTWQVGERWGRYSRILGDGKERLEDLLVSRRRGPISNDECMSCKSGSAHVPTSVTSSVRTNFSGWLTFRSGSSGITVSSAATSVTSATLSVKALPKLMLANELRERLIGPKRIPAPTPAACSCIVRLAVAPGECPLTWEESGVAAVLPKGSDVSLLVPVKMWNGPASLAIQSHWQRIRQSVAGFVDAAQRIQEAYASAAMVSDLNYEHPRRRRYSSSSRSTSRSRTRTVSPRRTSTSTRQASRLAPGYRVASSDLCNFLSIEQHINHESPAIKVRAIINGPSSLGISLRELSFAPPPRVFSPLASVPRSPLKPRFAPRQPEGRYRPIGNGSYLRVRALANICAAQGLLWEGSALASGSSHQLPMTRTSGAERLRGVAVDGIGRSSLRQEVLPQEQPSSKSSTQFAPARMTVPRRRRPGW